MVKRLNIKSLNLKTGALHRQLGIPINIIIPMILLRKIILSKPGMVIRNPTRVGRRRIRVTRLLERRAILAVNLKNIVRRNK